MKILFIEDDATTATAVSLSLQVFVPSATLVVAQNGRTGIEKFCTEKFDIIILDLGLPDMDGLQVLQKIRKTSQTPILIVSARHDPEVITRAFNEGAQDYILKPFNTTVFIRCIKELVIPDDVKKGRSEVTRVTEQFSINNEIHQAVYGTTPVELNDMEWQVLDCFVQHWGRMVTLKALSEIMNLKREDDNQLIHNTINQLRKKIGDDPYLPKIILAEFGCGYRLVRTKT